MGSVIGRPVVMCYAILMRFLPVILAVLLLAAAPASADGQESVVRRYLALVYEGRFDALPKAAAARTETFERQVRSILRVRCIRPDSISISAAGEDAVHADVVIEKQERNGEWFAVDFVPLRVDLVRDGESWLVGAVTNRDEEFAERLLQVRGEEREQLLREQPERISKGLARALYARVLVNLNNSAFDAAADARRMVLRIAIDAGDRGGESLALGATMYVTRNEDGGEADRLTRQSLAIAATVGDPDVLARAWYDRGRSTLQRPQRAREMLECYVKAREFAERAEDPALLVRVLYSLANFAANSQDDYLGARRYLDDALPIAREIGDVAGESGLESVMATIYREQGDVERARVHLLRATELAKRSNAFAYPTFLARLGSLLLDEKKYGEAREIFARVVTRNANGETTPAIGSMPKSHVANVLHALGEIEAQSGNLSEAKCLHREAAMHHRVNPNVYLYKLAPYFSRRGNDREALALSLASLTDLKPSPAERAQALRFAAQAYRNLGDVQRGLEAALEAIDLREEIDSRVAGAEEQRALASRMTSELYELAAELSLEVGDPLGAMAFLERGRARVLTDILANGRPGSMAEADQETRERQAALDREVIQISAEIDRARTARDETRMGDLTGELKRARAIRDSFLDGVRARTERWDGTRRRIDSDTVCGLGTRLPPRTVAVEYFVAERRLHIFVVGADGVLVRSTPTSRSVLDERVSAYLEMLARGDLRAETAGRELYGLLIAPIEKEIGGAEALLIVPDDALWHVPFAALVDRCGSFLVESRMVFYAPSVTAHLSITESRRERKSRTVSLFAVGNPTNDEAASRVALSFYRNADLGPLPDAEREVDAVRKLYGAAHSIVLKRDQATEARTKAQLGNVAIAHFATHAILDDANPMYSRLMLARGAETGEDGWLESWEVARLNLNADLVVLSACDTARGRAGVGEGVVGLAWSFFLAGASSTVATQWKVASDRTARFMIAFHRALRAPAAKPVLHKAQSLRAAQLQFIRNPQTRHPFHWAAFVLLGDPAVPR